MPGEKKKNRGRNRNFIRETVVFLHSETNKKTTDTMKRLHLIAIALASVLAFASCEEETAWYMPTGMWVMLDNYGNALPTTLSFNGATVAVQNATDYNEWPAGDAVYEYHVNYDNVLKMRVEYEYFDGEEYHTTSDDYNFKMTLTHEERRMVLVYDPWIGSKRTYYFDKL